MSLKVCPFLPLPAERERERERESTLNTLCCLLFDKRIFIFLNVFDKQQQEEMETEFDCDAEDLSLLHENLCKAGLRPEVSADMITPSSYPVLANRGPLGVLRMRVQGILSDAEDDDAMWDEVKNIIADDLWERLYSAFNPLSLYAETHGLLLTLLKFAEQRLLADSEPSDDLRSTTPKRQSGFLGTSKNSAPPEEVATFTGLSEEAKKFAAHCDAVLEKAGILLNENRSKWLEEYGTCWVVVGPNGLLSHAETREDALKNSGHGKDSEHVILTHLGDKAVDLGKDVLEVTAKKSKLLQAEEEARRAESLRSAEYHARNRVNVQLFERMRGKNEIADGEWVLFEDGELVAKSSSREEVVNHLNKKKPGSCRYFTCATSDAEPEHIDS